MKFELIQDAEYMIGPSILFSCSTVDKKFSRSSIFLVCSPLGTQEVTIMIIIKLKKFFICIPRY